MIFPFLRGILLPTLAPATWFLVVINLFVFTVTYETQMKAQERMGQLIDDKEFMHTQGAVFSNFVKVHPNQHSSVVNGLADRALSGDRSALRLMGGLALRSHTFLTQAGSMDIQGDEIALAQWRDDFKVLRKIQHRNPSNYWGLSADNNSWRNWITYQFSHGGFAHLFWNMLFLLIFGCWLETTLGSSLVILCYLGGGLAGAHAFAALEGISSKPLVGASAAISALIALTAVFHWKERCRFFYWWLLPGREYSGFLILPAWMLLFLFSLPDIGGWLGTVPEFSGVAFTAHIGGTLMGVMMGVALHLGLLQKEIDPDEELLIF